MGLQVGPLVSYADLQLRLPDTKALWRAPDAASWYFIFTARTDPMNQITLMDCMNDAELLSTSSEYFDVEAASFAYLYAHWGLARECRQLSFTLQSRSQSKLVLDMRQQELVDVLYSFQGTLRHMRSESKDELLVMSERILMEFHVSIEDMQLLAGLEGQDEASRIHSTLQTWSESISSVQALFHANKILSTITNLSPGMIHGIYSVVTYHAGLVYWVAACLRQTHRIEALEHPVIQYDKDEDRIARSGPNESDFRLAETGRSDVSMPDAIDDPIAALDLVLHILKSNHDTIELHRPPLVESLLELVKALREAVKNWQTATR